AEAAEEKERGNTAFAKKQYAEAMRCFSRCMELDPSCEVYPSNRSAAHASLEQWEEAAADARRVVALKPGWAKGWSRLGAACVGLRLYGDAAEAYRRALKIEPDDQALHKACQR
ncbi:Protein STIP1, partial [Tetrabaena socialis]